MQGWAVPWDTSSQITLLCPATVMLPWAVLSQDLLGPKCPIWGGAQPAWKEILEKSKEIWQQEVSPSVSKPMIDTSSTGKSEVGQLEPPF